ncbi:MAG: hypothetical protein GY863_09180 [bacterium]|nr:hypothetical protein [bacterium]
MELILKRNEIEDLLKGKERIFESRFGRIRIYDAGYLNSKFIFRMEHFLAGSILGNLDRFTINDTTLTCVVDFGGSIKGTFLNLFGSLLKEEHEAFSLEYPEIKVDLASLPLPINVDGVLLLEDEIRITGEINEGIMQKKEQGS